MFANKTLKVIYILGRTYTWNKNLFEDYLSTRFINPFGVETQKAHNFLDVYTVKRLISQMWIEVQLQFVKFAHICKCSDSTSLNGSRCFIAPASYQVEKMKSLIVMR